MSSTMALWDDAPPLCLTDYNRPLARRRPGTCERCGRNIPQPRLGWIVTRFCSELCRKRAERARWKARWKARGVNKYIGGRDK